MSSNKFHYCIRKGKDRYRRQRRKIRKRNMSFKELEKSRGPRDQWKTIQAR